MYVFSLRPNPQSIRQNQHYFLPSQLRRFRLEKAGRRRIRGLDHIGSDEPFFPFVSLRGRRMLAPASAMSERKPGYGATMVCRWGMSGFADCGFSWHRHTGLLASEPRCGVPRTKKLISLRGSQLSLFQGGVSRGYSHPLFINLQGFPPCQFRTAEPSQDFSATNSWV